MDSFNNACWNHFINSILCRQEDGEEIGIIESDDHDTIKYLKTNFLQSLNLNKAKLPSFTTQSSHSKTTGSSRGPTAYNLYYKQWKKDNPAEEFSDPENSEHKIKPRIYFNTHVWGVKTDVEKANIKKEFQKETGQGAKERKDYSAFGFFKDRHRPLMEEAFTPDELSNLKHPTKQAPITLYRFIQFLWTEHVNKDPELSHEFNQLSKTAKTQLEKGITPELDLDDLSHLDMSQVTAFKFDNLKMIQD